MMKKGILFCLAILAISLFSCSKEKDIDKNELKGDETYAGITVQFPKTLSTRAVDPSASVFDVKVTSVGVYIIDDLSGYMQSNLFTGSQFEESLVTPNVYTLTSAIKTTSGSKRIAVVLNPNATLQSMIELQRGGIFDANAIDGTTNSFVDLTDGIVMANKEILSAVLPKGQTAVQALATPLSIEVQRNVAKIAVKQKSASITVVGGSIANPEYALVVEAQKSYLIQQGGSTFTTVRTPGWSFDPITAINPYFTKLATPSSWKSINANTVENKDLDGYYTLENVNEIRKIGNTTAAIIKLQYTPTANTVITAYAADGTKTLGTITSGSSFYVKKSDNSFWSESAYANALANGFTADHFSKKYENGIGYYRIWIKDIDGNIGVIRNKFYLLNVTKITGPGLPYVPGVDETDPTSPKDPDAEIEEDTYISVEITVLPWNVETTDHEI